MQAVITMDKFGRMVLPGPMRKALQISRPAAFKAEVMGNKVELTLVAPDRTAIIEEAARSPGGFHGRAEV